MWTVNPWTNKEYKTNTLIAIARSTHSQRSNAGKRDTGGSEAGAWTANPKH